MRLAPGTAPRAAPYDRNPATTNQEGGASVSEGVGSTTKWTYTVPSARLALFGVVTLDQLCTVAASTTTAGDAADTSVTVQPTGGTELTAFIVRFHSDNMAPGDRAHDTIAAQLVLQAGDVVRAKHAFAGGAPYAGRMLSVATGLFTEFDI